MIFDMFIINIYIFLLSSLYASPRISTTLFTTASNGPNGNTGANKMT